MTRKGLLILALIAKGGMQARAAETELKWKAPAPEPTGECPMAGTLSLPEHPKAAALIIHGSGTLNRDGNVRDTYYPYRDIARHLESEGVAVLRYDKRSSIRECVLRIDHPGFSPETFIEDARGALRQLRARPELKGLPVFVIGHSQGVNFAVEIALKDQADGVVLMAGLGKYPMDVTLIRQLRNQAAHPGIPDDVRKGLEKLVEQAEIYFKRLRAGEVKPEEKLMGAHARFWRDSIEITERAAAEAAKLKVPALVLQGSLDDNVIRGDFDAFVEATKGVEGSGSRWFEGLHHLFATMTGTKVEKAVLDALSAWILGRAGF